MSRSQSPPARSPGLFDPPMRGKVATWRAPSCVIRPKTSLGLALKRWRLGDCPVIHLLPAANVLSITKTPGMP